MFPAAACRAFQIACFEGLSSPETILKKISVYLVRPGVLVEHDNNLRENLFTREVLTRFRHLMGYERK